MDYRPLLRAALHNLDQWVTGGVLPPPSRHPRLSKRTAVTRDRVLQWFDSLPGFEIPDANRLPFVRTVDMGAEESVGVANYPAEEGAFYPALVSAIDDDGNGSLVFDSRTLKYRSVPMLVGIPVTPVSARPSR